MEFRFSKSPGSSVAERGKLFGRLTALEVTGLNRLFKQVADGAESTLQLSIYGVVLRVRDIPQNFNMELWNWNWDYMVNCPVAGDTHCARGDVRRNGSRVIPSEWFLGVTPEFQNPNWDERRFSDFNPVTTRLPAGPAATICRPAGPRPVAL